MNYGGITVQCMYKFKFVRFGIIDLLVGSLGRKPPYQAFVRLLFLSVSWDGLIQKCE